MSEKVEEQPKPSYKLSIRQYSTYVLIGTEESIHPVVYEFLLSICRRGINNKPLPTDVTVEVEERK